MPERGTEEQTRGGQGETGGAAAPDEGEKKFPVLVLVEGWGTPVRVPALAVSSRTLIRVSSRSLTWRRRRRRMQKAVSVPPFRENSGSRKVCISGFWLDE